MMGLVDYGSGSESDNEDSRDGDLTNRPHLVEKPVEKNESPPLDDGFFSTQDIADSTNQESVLHLPAASHAVRQNNEVAEGELEDIVKRKDWEIELAEKTKKKLLKKAKKEKKKEKKDKKKEKEAVNGEQPKEVKQKGKSKAQITAFGALGSLGKDSDSEDEVKDKSPAVISTVKKGSGLLGMLPAPKKQGLKSSEGLGGAAKSGTGILLPPSLRGKVAPKPAPVVDATKNKRKAESDDDDSDDDGDLSDFFGLSAAPEAKVSRLQDATSVPLLASSGFDAVAGPSKPTPMDYVHPSQMYNYANLTEEDLQGPEGPIYKHVSDEQAYKMLSRDEGVQIERRNIHNIATNLVEYSVDAALGPNVQANILKNMHKKNQIRESAMPLPKSKNPTDKISRQKHQITYLANLAVSREEALQEQWSNNKQQKQMSRQKYGF